MPNEHTGHDQAEQHEHEHHPRGHANDQGIKGALRYLRLLPQMWRSPINDAVVDLVDPKPGERVVDIGAGMGAGAMRAAATGAHVIAVEPTPFMRRVLNVRRMFSFAVATSRWSGVPLKGSRPMTTASTPSGL